MNPLVLDIETFSLDEAAAFLEEPSAPANYKDPVKIADYIRQKTAENLSRCALDPDLCRVVAVGVHGNATYIEIIEDASHERDVLTWLWGMAAPWDGFVGFNLLSFDLPVLIRRSQYLGVEVPALALNLDKYRTPHIDLMERLSFNGKIKAHSLDFYCRRFGIEVEDSTTGEDVDAMVRAENWTAVADHCRADVLKTRLLAQRLGYVPTAAPDPETAAIF